MRLTNEARFKINQEIKRSIEILRDCIDRINGRTNPLDELFVTEREAELIKENNKLKEMITNYNKKR